MQELNIGSGTLHNFFDLHNVHFMHGDYHIVNYTLTPHDVLEIMQTQINTICLTNLCIISCSNLIQTGCLHTMSFYGHVCNTVYMYMYAKYLLQLNNATWTHHSINKKVLIYE